MKWASMFTGIGGFEKAWSDQGMTFSAMCEIDANARTVLNNQFPTGKLAYKSYKLKLAPETVSAVGNIASAHSKGVDHAIEVTRDLNMSADDFGHSESCFWQSYYASRCVLKSNGGFGLRTFTGDYDYVAGRSWVIPLKSVENVYGEDTLVPTFNTETPDAFVVFNGYGNLEGYTAARIMSHMAGMTYRKISFTASPVYVNGDSGYLVAPEDIAANYTDGSLHLSVDEHSSLFNNERRTLSYA